MSWTNSYRAPPPPDPSELYGPTPYDFNFAFPLHAAALRNERVALVPFVPRVHAAPLFAAFGSAAEQAALFRHLPWRFASLEHMLALLEQGFRRDPGCCLFVIIDRTTPGPFAIDAERTEGEGNGEGGGEGERGARTTGALAGTIGIIHGDAPNLRAEIGAVIVLPAFQGTHVARNAIGLLLRYCLDLPGAPSPGLGLRRVEWLAHPDNAASAGVATKMGFVEEGLMRWTWVRALFGSEGEWVDVNCLLVSFCDAGAARGRGRLGRARGRSEGERKGPSQPLVLAVLGRLGERRKGEGARDDGG
jgi:RimJ/RimL family protein N-acetyltransferase